MAQVVVMLKLTVEIAPVVCLAVAAVARLAMLVLEAKVLHIALLAAQVLAAVAVVAGRLLPPAALNLYTVAVAAA